MSTNFEKNSIRLTETPATKVSPPDSSKDIKLFQENGEVKVKDFAGNVKPLVPPMELKVAQVAVNSNEDANEYVLRIPSPNAKLIALEATLRDLIATGDATLDSKIEVLRVAVSNFKIDEKQIQDLVNLASQDTYNRISDVTDNKLAELS
jgi:hypothetical protein